MRSCEAILLGVAIWVAGLYGDAIPAAEQIPPRVDFLQEDMDRSVNPGEDFFQFANGGWLKRNPIPASEPMWGIGSLVKEQLYVNLRTINEQAAASAASAGSDQQKIGDWWATAMDAAKAEQLGVHPLDAELDRVAKVRSAREALDVAFAWQPLQVRAFFAFDVAQDDKNSGQMAIYLNQAGLGLPNREFYFNPEKGVAKVREEYVAHIARTLAQLGRDDVAASKAAAAVMEFETSLAKASRNLEDLRDPQLNYNKMTPAEVTARITPTIGWTDRLAEWNLHPPFVVVGQPEFLAVLDRLLGQTPVPVLQDYLRARLVATYAETLSKAFDDEHFRFYHQVLSGQNEPRPRWKRVLTAQNEAMGMILGRIFVKEYFPEAAKKRYSDLVEAIRASYRDRIDRLEWMSDATKAKAQQKLAAITSKVGYPDRWKDYSALVVGRVSYCENSMNAKRWRFNDKVSKFGKPADRNEWAMTPQSWNAYYNSSNNEIVLPAAIFTVPGVSDADVDDAVVYGNAGALIGHEITHGFDDWGRKFDAAGNLADWWTPSDAEKFQQRSTVMVKQFDAYEPLPGLHINGKASLGENIADHGGLLLALEAFKKTDQYKEGREIGGLTPIQRLFLGYALGRMIQIQEAWLRLHLLSDVHSPPKWRVLGPLSNIPEFYQAFGVKPGQPLWRPEADHVRIW
jgi:putative endopeptidase